jgi:hypothetical protein
MVSLAFSAAALTALGACASTAPTASTAPANTAAASIPPGCVHDTGGRLAAASGCTAFGHSYSHEDIARTGQTTVSSALALIDPTISIH